MQLGRTKSVSPTPIILQDALRKTYDFFAYPISEKIYAENAVYAFAHRERGAWVLHFVGATQSLVSSLTMGSRLQTAQEAGATHTLVHVPVWRDEVKHTEAAMRIAHAYKPPMNRNYTTRFGAR